MEPTEQVTLTNMCMIQSGSKVLALEKVWEDGRGVTFPGGHVERHEPIVDSVIREVKEETGLTIQDPLLCGSKEWVEEDGSRYMVFLFRASRFTGELTSSGEGRVFWVDRDDVLKTNWIWHLDSLMRIFQGGDKSELFLDADRDWEPVLK